MGSDEVVLNFQQLSGRHRLQIYPRDLRRAGEVLRLSVCTSSPFGNVGSQTRANLALSDIQKVNAA
jgi:hypothetical protein